MTHLADVPVRYFQLKLPKGIIAFPFCILYCRSAFGAVPLFLRENGS